MKIRVWDIPTRLFHWMLVAAYAGAFFSSGNEWLIEYHTIAGYIAMGLVAFRVLWGFTGSRYSRFGDFVKGFGTVRSFIRETLRLKPPRYLGHNPAVGWVVVFLLVLTIVIVTTGIVTYGGEENRGIWAGVFTFEAASTAKAVHLVLADIAIAAIIAHICAALFHDFVLKENIILSMITGTKEDPESWSERVEHLKPEEAPSAARLAVWIVVTILGGLALIYLPPEGKGEFTGREAVQVADGSGSVVMVKPDPVWKDECATSCHSAFHPTLLPEASWDKIMSTLDDHFGDNVSLDSATRDRILKYLVASSAERSTTEASRKILYSMPKSGVPLRITDLPYWVKKHEEIKEEVYKRKSVVSKSNCVACHPGAEAGSFEDKDIRVPKE
ncbi:MAG: cytochrome b/b6 domain-containing protein [Deltaproteobacteria bacterium]|nr:cytochrome b/b6 domain-containing protein [Deltaproteobacteria bacterium]